MNTTADLTAIIGYIKSDAKRAAERRPVSPLFPFQTVADVRSANKAAGRYFFNRDTMNAQNSRIESTLYRGAVFITSEQFHTVDYMTGETVSEPRTYSVRVALPTADISSPAAFRRLATLEEARTAARTLAIALKKDGYMAQVAAQADRQAAQAAQAAQDAAQAQADAARRQLEEPIHGFANWHTWTAAAYADLMDHAATEGMTADQIRDRITPGLLEMDEKVAPALVDWEQVHAHRGQQ